jgi:hypothetical protein
MKRKPVRKKKIHKASERKEAMLAVIGLWKDRADIPDAETYVRYLRNDDRMKRVLRPSETPQPRKCTDRN